MIIKKKNKNHSEYMHRIFSTFIECTQTETRENNKSCELFRVHYIDIRKKGNDYFDSILYNFRKTLDRGDFKKNLKLLKKFTNITKTELINMYNIDVKNNYYIQKELSKTPLKEEILRFCHDKLEKDIHNYDINDLNIYSKKILDMYPKLTRDITFFFTSRLIKITAIMVDIYTLSRMFRTEFKNVKKYQPKKQHNIIMQAGDCHSKIYRSFLKKLKFKMVETSGKETGSCYKNNFKGVLKSTRCLDFKNIYQPLFN